MFHYAILAGICASAASFFGKFISYVEVVEENVNYNNNNKNEQILLALNNPWLIRLLGFALMVICNGMVWTFFVKALHGKGGSLAATVTSAATNYSISAILGYLIFNETTSAIWWLGTILVISGVLLISTDGVLYKKKKTNKC